MHILVAGAAGGVGNKLVSELAQAGHSVTGLVHSEDKCDRVKEAGGMPVLGDVTDVASLADPVAQADVVVFAAGSGGKAVEAVDRDGAINLIDVAQEKGVERFVMLSSMAAGEPEKGPDDLRDYLIAKGRADDHLQASSLDYVIVRPGSLTDDGGNESIRAAPTGNVPSGEIARADVAKTLAACAQGDAPKNASFDMIAGDQPISQALSSLGE